MKKNKRILITALLILIFSYQVNAQLQAGFITDKSGGCSPLELMITNTTKGGTASTKYFWSLGNGNSSTLVNPGATYNDEKTYSITLTAEDGGKTSTISKEITVYKKPIIDFTATPLKGCAPLNVYFTATVNPGNGTNSYYLWDFGDGKTIQGNNYDETFHTYTIAIKPPISLTVTNSFGCYATKDRNDLVDVTKPVIAAFTASKTVFCSAGAEVIFTNNSIGNGTLNYLWDFGDGLTSIIKSPRHIYDSKGVFTVKLTVTSSDGCTVSAKQLDIHVGNFEVNFSTPAISCSDQLITFENQSTLPFDSVAWHVNANKITPNSNGDLQYLFLKPGTYSVMLTAYYDQCSFATTKIVIVNPTPNLLGFVSQIYGACDVPVTIAFSDTTNDAVKWLWKYNNNTTVFDSAKKTSRTFTNGTSDIIGLTVIGKEGCKISLSKTVTFAKPEIVIAIKKSTSPPPSTNRGCPGLDITFTTTPLLEITNFKWNFGDGQFSTWAEPQHVYNTNGSYSVSLAFVTKNGCRGIAYFDSIHVTEITPFDFTVLPGQLICGNSPTTFIPTQIPNCDYIWLIDGAKVFESSSPVNFIYRFNRDTVYTVSLILRSGLCTDTLTKVDYITVLPPFPQIKQVINTCFDTRGLVVFTDTSRKAILWNWEFGDGDTDEYGSYKDSIKHVYTASGKYKVKLTTTNGPCTLADSSEVHVLLKQDPSFSSNVASICTSDTAIVTLNNMEPNPAADSAQGYSILKLQYNDLSASSAMLNIGNWTTFFSGELSGFETGKEAIRVITQSLYFDCMDTSNFAKLKINGPMSGLGFQPIKCLDDTLKIWDASIPNSNSPIVKWDWFFDVDSMQSTSVGGSILHQYSKPGNHYISLRVTDAGGCVSQTPMPDSKYLLQLTGPVANFDASAYEVYNNTTVDFINTSAYFDNCQTAWHFSNGYTSIEDNFSYIFNKEGLYDVQMIATNKVSGCRDTIQKKVNVLQVHSSFTATVNYPDSNHCPPLIVYLKSTSLNATRLSWNFGDGGEGGNLKEVEHVFTNPGNYRVVLYSYDPNDAVDSMEQYFEVKGPSAFLHADTYFACNFLRVMLSADTVNAFSFKWDFGDGTITASKDTFASHLYSTPGIYLPALILIDKKGCRGTSVLTRKIIIDSLNVNFAGVPSLPLCDSGSIKFTPVVGSLTERMLKATLQYRWTNSANIQDTTSNKIASWNFNKTGIYDIQLRVNSPYGCEVIVDKKVEVKRSPVAIINGPRKICQGDSASFAGGSIPPGGIAKWQWNFGGNVSSFLQNPFPITYSKAGLQPLSLIVSDSYCSDTAYGTVDVRNNPVVSILSAKPYTCSGDSIQLTASGANICIWTPVLDILNAGKNTATVWPAANRFYTAKITNEDGCTSKDSIEVKIIQPFTMQVKSPLFTCAGGTIQFISSGASKYKWLSAGIMGSSIANPVAFPKVSATYTVVGFDAFGCFTDTAHVSVIVGALPTINAKPDQKLIAGYPTTLNTISSNNVVKWTWSPADYLQCTNCPSPVCIPKKAMQYIVTATTAQGCIAKDTVRIEMVCGSDLVYVPTGFTPNDDNLNDNFSVQGSGISIRRLAIFNRWGKIIFERKDANTLDRNSGWDGKYNGQPQPSGAYVYLFEAVCNSGETFTYKGTFVLIR